MELLSPKLDIVFKSLFTSADSSDILSDFLASVLDIDTEEIKDIRVLNTELLPQTLDEKYSRLDVAVKIQDKVINIEMQMKKVTDFKERVLFYWSNLYTQGLESGKSYRNLKQTISINILDFKMFDCEECHSIFRLREENRNELLTDKCRFDFLELPKADKDKSPQIKRLKRWLNFFNMKTKEDADMFAKTDDKVMNKAVFILHKMSADEKMRELARIRERALHDEASYLEDAIEEGMAKGMAKGREEGIADMITRMKAFGMPEEQINQIMSVNI